MENLALRILKRDSHNVNVNETECNVNVRQIFSHNQEGAVAVKRHVSI